jgi:hypothetical protein
LRNNKSDELLKDPEKRAKTPIRRVRRAIKVLISPHFLVSILAGWYLMVPRVTLGPKGIYHAALEAPLSDWSRQGPFDTLPICTKAKEALSKLSESKVRENDTNSVAAELSAYAAECMAQDDPRFKGK